MYILKLMYNICKQTAQSIYISMSNNKNTAHQYNLFVHNIYILKRMYNIRNQTSQSISTENEDML